MLFPLVISCAVPCRRLISCVASYPLALRFIPFLRCALSSCFCVAPVVFRLRLLSIDRCSFACSFPYFLFQLSFVPLSVFHISFPLPYLISLFLTPISYLTSSPLSQISSLSPLPFVSALSISFPRLPHLFLLSFPLLSPYPKPSGRHCSPARWTSRPRWCNAQECMERPMSVYTFARSSPISSAVSSLSRVGDPPGRARARILYCKPTRKEGEQIFIRNLFFQKKKQQKIISITSFSLVQLSFS